MGTVIITEENGVKGEKATSISLLGLQNLILIKRILRQKLLWSDFEAARLICPKSRQRKIEKRMNRIHSWVRFIKINGQEVLVLAPSIMALGIEAKVLNEMELSTCLQEVFAHRTRKLSSAGR